jgi:uncharacterized membrane protein YgcG
MKPLAALAAATLAIGALVAPALAAEYVHDGASMLSPATVTQLDSTIGSFYAQTHKEVLVDTVPSLDGATVAAAAERVFAQQRVNGVLIYIAKAEHKIEIVPDRASRAFFPSGSFDPIYATMSTSFKAGDFNGGVTNAVDLIINTYRGHEGALRERRTENYVPATTTQVVRSNTGGFTMGFIWWLIVLAVIFFVVRLILRAMVGPRMYPPGYGGGPGPGGPYAGGPGYGPGYGGPGYGYGGGGGGFWSGLLGGLGGAWLGNEMFGGNRETIIEQPANYADVGGGYGQDQSGFQNDPGQADMGNAAGGGWGDSSGGGWGGGDSGGGGWGDGGGGGGSDSGGGW